jgi:K+-sensing histidine kinase KdpD
MKALVMKRTSSLRSSLTSLTGVVISASSAVLISFFFRGQSSKFLVTVMFLAVILIVAMRCGVLAGVLGSVIGALIFAIYLYQPLGSVAIANKAARASLAWMLLGGIAFSYLLGSNVGGRERQN